MLMLRHDMTNSPTLNLTEAGLHWYNISRKRSDSKAFQRNTNFSKLETIITYLQFFGICSTFRTRVNSMFKRSKCFK